MIKLGISKVKFYLGNKKVKYIFRGSTKVWSGASVVSYYDGNTLLGTEEVDEGEDVLRPSIDTSKSGYTLVGWSITSDKSGFVENLVATGAPMTLYAIYVPNTLTVATGSVALGNYSLTSQNKEYVTGSFGNYDARAGYYVGPGWILSGFDINIKKGFYQGGTLNFNLINEAPFDASSYYMGSSISAGAHSVQIGADGRYYGGTRGSVDYHTSGGVAGGVTSVVLTNPKAWE